VAQVIYNGNGSTGGSVPVDNNNYAPNASFSVATPGGLSLGSSPFFFWNTKADGTGTIFNPGANTFPNQTTNLTLFAIWGVTTGLTNGGVTTHFNFFYDPSLGGAGGIEPARINQLLAAGAGGKPVIENDFDWLQAQFAGVDMTKARSFPITVHVTAVVESGYNAYWGWPVVMNAGHNPSTLLRSMFISEVSETFMLAQDKGWGYSNGVGNEESCGEALSLFLTVQFQLSQGLGTTWLMNGTPSTWLDTSLPASNPASTEFDSTGQFGGPSTGTHYGSRQDYVGTVKPWAGNGPATGCCMAFLYYLFHQLQFTSIPQIIAAAPGVDSSNNVIGGSCLKGVYKNLTGDNSDPFPYFASLLAVAYPPDQVANIPGPNVDDPWPIGVLSFVGSKNTWGHDEILDIIANGGTYPDGIYLALDGFSKNVVAGGVPSVPSIAFGGTTAATTATPPAIFYQSPNPKVPQQIVFTYDVNFAQPLGTFPATGETPAAVNSSITVLGTSWPAVTEFFFLAGADPYFTNVVQDPTDPTALTVPWLSEDLRVFTATPSALPAAKYQYPVPGGPQFIEHSSGVGNFDFNGAYNYVQALLLYLNQNYGNPSGVDPFLPGSNVIPQQQNEFTADSSVAPFSAINRHTYNNYSFAIARVRLKGSQGTAGEAAGVRVFFRLWGTQTADTGWDPTSTYLSHTDGSGNPVWPLAPSDNHTIPFFATSPQPNFGAANDPEFQTGGFTNTGANNLTITINQGDSQWAYFGCFINVNDASVQFNNVAVPLAFPGTHHCLVAQIAYAGAPIQTVGGSVPTPESGDQLAQRNLQVTTTDNPGPPSTHRVPQTFDVKPSATPPASGPLAGRPDELMIDWGDVPPGSTARIYWPAVSSAEVIKLASWMYGVHPLITADAHTIEVKTFKGVTFVPIPQGKGAWFAGLLTLDLPQTVVTGQEFDIVVRRIGKRPLRIPPPPAPPSPEPQIATSRTARSGERRAHAPAPARAVGTGASGTAAGGERRAVVPSPTRAVAAPQLWERYIVGSFQVKIPVSTGDAMLPAEETTLAILKARLEAMPKTDRWYPVLLRYIEQVAGRVDGLGGDANSIPPSLGGYLPPSRGRGEGNLQEFTGKVCEVEFDCFGEFVGFVLDDCCERWTFKTREREIGELVLRALKERFTLTVDTVGKNSRVVRLAVKG
jgi:hypothetical protein